MDFGDGPDGSDNQRRRKRYHRHTPRQIQQLEAVFKECQHPDENQRAELSRELGLDPRQIKFWFQNRRTQMKAQTERADNSFLRADNDRIRMENITMREALKNVVCPNCGGPPVAESFFDEQKLRSENARLQEEINRLASLTSKHLGRPVTQPMPTMDPPVGGMSEPAPLDAPPLDLDLLGAPSSGTGMPAPAFQIPAPAFQMPAPVTEVDRSMMMDTAVRAMDELIRLAQAGDHVWIKGPPGDERETLHVPTYDGLFTRPGAAFRMPDTNVEGSRDSGIVFMSAIALVDLFMDTNKWMEFFPGIVSKAYTVDVIMNGMSGANESLIMMSEELHVMTPLVPPREFTFLRYCKLMDQGLWAVVDVSVDGRSGIPPSRSRRLPSGCLIADMANGYSNVTWVEHVELDQMLPVHAPFQNLVLSGAAFGARRWLGALQRACDRFATLAVLSTPYPDPSGVTPEGRRSVMKLSQRMVSSFGGSLIFSPSQQWTLLPGPPDVSIRASTHDGVHPSQPLGVVLTAVTSIWLAVSCDRVFAFLRNESTRSQWDIQSSADQHLEVARITNGANPGNCISLVQAHNSSLDTNTLILQESCTDASGSMVVYSSMDFTAANMVMGGGDPSCILLLPSGFTILPDARTPGAGASSSNSAPVPGCVVTGAFQMLDPNLRSTADVNADSVATITTLATTTVQRIRSALNIVDP